MMMMMMMMLVMMMLIIRLMTMRIRNPCLILFSYIVIIIHMRTVDIPCYEHINLLTYMKLNTYLC